MSQRRVEKLRVVSEEGTARGARAIALFNEDGSQYSAGGWLQAEVSSDLPLTVPADTSDFVIGTLEIPTAGTYLVTSDVVSSDYDGDTKIVQIQTTFDPTPVGQNVDPLGVAGNIRVKTFDGPSVITALADSTGAAGGVIDGFTLAAVKVH